MGFCFIKLQWLKNTFTQNKKPGISYCGKVVTDQNQVWCSYLVKRSWKLWNHYHCSIKSPQLNTTSCSIDMRWHYSSWGPQLNQNIWIFNKILHFWWKYLSKELLVDSKICLSDKYSGLYCCESSWKWRWMCHWSKVSADLKCSVKSN